MYYTACCKYNNKKHIYEAFIYAIHRVTVNVLCQHKYSYIKDERSGVESYPLTQWRKAVTSTLAIFLFSSHPKREKNWQVHLNYYT